LGPTSGIAEGLLCSSLAARLTVPPPQPWIARTAARAIVTDRHFVAACDVAVRRSFERMILKLNLDEERFALEPHAMLF
jgi:hypothetical protein